MEFYVGLLLAALLLASWSMTRQIRAFISNPIESLVGELVSYVKSDTLGKKNSSWDRDGPKHKLKVGDYYDFWDSPPSTDGSFSFYHRWFHTTDFFEKAKIDVKLVSSKQAEYIKLLTYLSLFYFTLGIISLIIIVYFLLKWNVVPDWETGKIMLYATDMVFRGTPFGIAEYFLGSSFNELPEREDLAFTKLFANFWTSLIVIAGFLQILALRFRRKTLERHFHGPVGEINFIALFLLYARQIEDIARGYNHPDMLFGDSDGAVVFEAQLQEWEQYKRDLVENAIKQHMKKD